MLGWPSPDRLLEELTPEEWEGWLEYYSLEPFGFPVDDYRLGIMAAVIAKSAGAKDVKPSDFMISAHEELAVAALTPDPEDDGGLEMLRRAFSGAPPLQSTSRVKI